MEDIMDAAQLTMTDGIYTNINDPKGRHGYYNIEGNNFPFSAEIYLEKARQIFNQW